MPHLISSTSTVRDLRKNATLVAWRTAISGDRVHISRRSSSSIWRTPFSNSLYSSSAPSPQRKRTKSLITISVSSKKTALVPLSARRLAWSALATLSRTTQGLGSKDTLEFEDHL